MTRNLLRTHVLSEDGGKSVVAVTAHGYRGVPRVDYVPVRGGDGYLHDVPVEWTEYVPIEKTTPMTVMERDGLSLAEFRTGAQNGTSEFVSWMRSGRWSEPDRYFRRAMLAFVGQS